MGQVFESEYQSLNKELTSKDFSKGAFANLAQDKVLSSNDGRRRAHLRRQWRYLWAPEEEEKRREGEG
jgi:hypothetical protein